MSGAYDAPAKAIRVYTVDPVAAGNPSAPAGATVSSGSSTKPVAITPSDTTDLSASGIRGIYVGTTGNVSVIGVNDTTNSGAGTPVGFQAVPAGTTLWVAPKRVRATGTTATNLVGLA